MRRKGKRGEGKRLGPGAENRPVQAAYGRFRAWVSSQDPDDFGSGGMDGSEIASLESDRRAIWFRRMWQEGDRQEKESSLRLFTRVQPGDAGSFLREIVTSEGGSLREKKLALDLLRALDPQAAAGAHETDLEAAWRCVQRLVQEGPGEDGCSPAAGGDDVRECFDTLPAPLQGAVAAEVLEQTPGRALAFLGRVLPERESLWDHVLLPLARSPHEDAAALIREGYGRTRDSALRKRMKKTNHQRRSLGLSALPLEEEADHRRVVWMPVVQSRSEGLLAMGDNPNETLAWIFDRKGSAGIRVVMGWVHETRGLEKCLVTEFSKTEARDYRQSLLENPDFQVGEVDVGYCAYILEEAYKRGAPAEAGEAEAYRSARMMIRGLLPSETVHPPHPVQKLVAARDGEVLGDAELRTVQGVARLLEEHPPLKDWRLDAGPWERHQEKLEEILNSRIIIHPLQKQERVDTFCGRVAADVFSDPQERQRWKTRLEDAAWVAYQQGNRDLAVRLVRLGLSLEAPEGDPSQNRFCVALVRRTVEAWIRQTREEKRDTPSLIVKPPSTVR